MILGIQNVVRGAKFDVIETIRVSRKYRARKVRSGDGREAKIDDDRGLGDTSQLGTLLAV